MNRGINVTPLLDSNIFNPSFDYDDWPSIHHNTDLMIVPYNDSQFHLMFMYPKLFRELWKEEQEKDIAKLKGEEHYVKEKDDGKKSEKVRLKKKQSSITYHINLLPSVSQDQGQLMEGIALSNELDIFRSDCVQDLIEFKWNSFARAVHMSGFYFHFGYIFMQAIFIN